MAISSTVKSAMFMAICLLLTIHTLGELSNPVGLVVVVMSQNNAYHVSLAERLKSDVLDQADQQAIERPAIYLTHDDFADVQGAWTYLPIIHRLSEQLQVNKNCSWIFFCEDQTKIYLQQMVNLLAQYDSKQDVWIGYGLKDKEPTIIHHFSENSPFKYPHLGVGFAMSISLVNRIANQLDFNGFPASDFSIDPSYELAKYIYYSVDGVNLTHSSQLCIKYDGTCASVSLPFKPCNVSVPLEVIHFAVKTCGRFHIDRVPVVKSTWALEAQKNIAFYSDVKDSAIPTVDLGVPNTILGHCGKTTAILRHVAKRKHLQWLVIADDDTLISVARLRALLGCYSASDPVALGERYAYDLNGPRGYVYITGGGGIVLSMPAVQLLAVHCRCDRDSTPDDMYLGMCMAALNISVIHSPMFHQARPADYAPALLSVQRPISFHKHWMMDPLITYQEWLFEPQKNTDHSEL